MRRAAGEPAPAAFSTRTMATERNLEPPSAAEAIDRIAPTQWLQELRWRVRAHPAGFRALSALRLLSRPVSWAERRAVARRIEPPRLHIDPRLGWLRFAAADLPHGEEVVALSERVRRSADRFVDSLHAHQAGRYGIVFDLLSDDRLLAWPTFVDFAVSEAALGSVAHYFGTVPVLRRVSLAVSRHRPEFDVPQGSQRFHLDREDTTHVKMFLAIREVGPEDGPLTFLPAGASARVLRELRRRFSPSGGNAYHTYPDDAVFEHCDRSELVRLEGGPGEGVFLDTGRCLHYGSRTAPGRERLMMMISYQRHHFVEETPCNVFDRSRYRGRPLCELALSPPRQRPFGWFFPNPVLHPGPGARGRAHPLEAEA